MSRPAPKPLPSCMHRCPACDTVFVVAVFTCDQGPEQDGAEHHPVQGPVVPHGPITPALCPPCVTATIGALLMSANPSRQMFTKGR